MKDSQAFGVDLIDKENIEYNLSSYSYLTFKNLVQFSKYIIDNLEIKIFIENEKESEKTLMKK